MIRCSIETGISRQSHGLFGLGLVRRDRQDALERPPRLKLIRRASLRIRFRMCSRCSGSDALVRGCLDKATPFLGADRCAGTAKTPGALERRARAEIAPPSETEMLILKEGLLSWSVVSIPLHRVYLSYGPPFSRADSCFQIALSPLMAGALRVIV